MHPSSSLNEYDFEKRDTKWNWSAYCQRSPEQIKAMLTFNLLFTHFDFRGGIVVAAYFSNYGTSIVISYVCRRNKWRRFWIPCLEWRNFTNHWSAFLRDHRPLFATFGSKKCSTERQCSPDFNFWHQSTTNTRQVVIYPCVSSTVGITIRREQLSCLPLLNPISIDHSSTRFVDFRSLAVKFVA